MSTAVMTDWNTEPSPRLQARIAGVLYLIVIATGIFAEIFVREAVTVSGDAAATVSNILAHGCAFGWASRLSARWRLCHAWNVPAACIA